VYDPPAVAPLVPPVVDKVAAAAAKKAADDLKAKRNAYEAVVDAQIVNRARSWDVYGAHLPNAALVPSPIAIGGPIGATIKAGSLGTIVRSRRMVARSFQRQIDRYIPDHPNGTRDDINTVQQWRGKRDENNLWSDGWQVEAARTFFPGSNPVNPALGFISTKSFLDSYDRAEDAQYHTVLLARDKFLKNTSNIENRRAYNQAVRVWNAKKNQEQGLGAELVNRILPLAGGSASKLVGAYGSKKAIRAADTEERVAEEQRKIAQQKFHEKPTEDNYLALKLARATEDWKENSYDFAKARTLPFALPQFSLIFGAARYMDYREVQDAQKRVSRLTLETKRRAYEKLFQGADTAQRLPALDAYGRPIFRAPSPTPQPTPQPLSRVS